MKLHVLLTTASGLVLSGLVAPLSVQAQVADQSVEVTTLAAEAEGDRTLERVTVTGSRITRSDYTSPSPLVTTDVEDYVLSGRATVDDFLRDLPQFGPGSGDFSNDSNGGTAGRATLNLRNLGAKRNLVIMDGRRLVSSGTDGAIDINTIPSLAIGGIEVITGGASATYGSDALSGVVNFKTRTDLDGFEVDGQFSSLDDVGEDSFRIGAAYGTRYGAGRGNLLLTAEYTDRGGVRLRERDFFLVSPQASSFTAYGSFRTGGTINSLDDDGNYFQPSNLATAPPGFVDGLEPPLTTFQARFLQLRTLGQFDNFIQVPLEQTTLYAKTDFELSSNVTAYGHLLYADSTAFNEGAAPISSGIWGVTIPLTNPYLTANPGLLARVNSLVGTPDVVDNRLTGYFVRYQQAGGRVYNTENQVYQLLGGLNGSFEDLDLNWDVHFSYGKTETTDRTISGSVNFAEVQAIIDTTDATGQSPLCAGGFNPFGGLESFSPGCLDYVSRAPVNSTELSQMVLEGVLEGRAFDMAAGEARFALTGTYRENSYDFVPDADTAAAELANLIGVAATSGDVTAAEVAGELLLPLIADAEWADGVNLTLGARLSEYDPAGTAETYKIEMDARINEMLLLRGGYQRAVRAPNVEEFFRASLLRVQPYSDPCGSNNDPNVVALCVQQGAAPDYAMTSSSGPTVTNGNTDLIPETANTLTFGGVLDFELLGSRVQLTADYYEIEIEDAIETLTAQQVFTQCFNLDGFSNPAYDPGLFQCQQISRAANGFDLDPIRQPVLNLGGIKTSGIDLATNISMPIDALAWGGGDGGVTFRSLVNILTAYEVQSFAGNPFADFAGTVTGTDAFPELKMLNTVSVQTGPIDFTFAWRHIGEMDDIAAEANTGSIVKIDAFNYFDLTARYNINEKFEFYGGVSNLTDELPPQIGGEPGGRINSDTNQGVYDAIGRTFFVGARARF